MNTLAKRFTWRRLLALGLFSLFMLAVILGPGVIRLLREQNAINNLKAAGAGIKFAPDSDRLLTTFEKLQQSVFGESAVTDVEAIGFELPELATEDFLQWLGDLPNLHLVTIRGPKFTDSGARHIARVATLVEVHFYDTNLSGAGLQLLTQCPSLKGLILTGPKVTNSTLLGLKKLQSLQLVRLTDTSIGRVGLNHISSLKDLRSLTLLRCRNISVEAVQSLAPLTELEEIATSGIPWNDTSLEVCAKWKQLRRISIFDSKITDAGLQSIKSLRNLTMLDLPGALVTDAGVEVLTALPDLHFLDLSGARLTDASLPFLARFKFMTSLTLAGAEFTGKGIDALGSLTHLELLVLGEKVPAKDLDRLKRTLSHCEVFQRQYYVFPDRH